MEGRCKINAKRESGKRTHETGSGVEDSKHDEKQPKPRIRLRLDKVVRDDEEGVEDSEHDEIQPRPKIRLRLDKVVRDAKEGVEDSEHDEEPQNQPFDVQKILERLNTSKEKNDFDHDEDESDVRMVDEVLGKQFIKLFQEDRIGNRWELVNICWIWVILHQRILKN